jgi:threonine-phosphate decarboxylase
MNQKAFHPACGMVCGNLMRPTPTLSNSAHGPAVYAQGRHGGEIIKLAAQLGINPADILDFSCNANSFAFGLTRKIIGQTACIFQHYPDQNCARLNKAVAEHEAQEVSGGVSEENILSGNGAADLIWLALRVLSPRTTLFVGPVFSEYIRAADALRLNYAIIAPRPENGFACTADILRAMEESRAELTVLCTPNNPGGITYANLGEILSRVRSPRILIDLSYREFLYGTPGYAQTFRHNLNRLKNPRSELLCLHSFTKFFCCPGIRLGYLTGEKDTLAALAGQTPAWSVSQCAQDLGVIFLERLEEYRAGLPRLAQARQDFGTRLRSLKIFDPRLVLEGPVFFCCGLSARNTDEAGRGIANAEHPGPARPGALRNYLLERGLLIRDCDNIPGMAPGFVRIQVRSAEDNHRLLTALETAGQVNCF